MLKEVFRNFVYLIEKYILYRLANSLLHLRQYDSSLQHSVWPRVSYR